MRLYIEKSRNELEAMAVKALKHEVQKMIFQTHGRKAILFKKTVLDSMSKDELLEVIQERRNGGE